MEQPHLVLPRLLPVQQRRPPQETIPQTRRERDRIKAMVQSYVAELKPVPPMPVDDLRMHADTVVDGAGLAAKYRDYVAVLLNNEAWRETLAGIPYERRLLMLPKCLRVEAKCPAPFDEFGLLCKHCGLCSIQDLQDEAERLGYAVLVAEGSALVTAIIQTGKIDAIEGVSCLSVLEKAFPFMEAAAVPGIAIPLLQDDCIDTTVDTDWVWEVLHLTSDDRTYRMDLDGIRREVDPWFTPAGLDALLLPASTETERIGRAWLTRAGKRWRPFLTVCVYRALRQDPEAAFPESLKRIAVAIECFHKASLIHDDIEDRDEQWYGVDALHSEHGVAVALNVGDYLLGEGYRLLATCGAPPETCAAMLRAAAEGHRTLALGQGMELSWARAPKPLTSLEVLDIFRKRLRRLFKSRCSWGRTSPQATRTSKRCSTGTARPSASRIRFATTSTISLTTARGPTAACVRHCRWRSRSSARTQRSRSASCCETPGPDQARLTITHASSAPSESSAPIHGARVCSTRTRRKRFDRSRMSKIPV